MKIDEKTVVHCQTKELAKEVVKVMEGFGCTLGLSVKSLCMNYENRLCLRSDSCIIIGSDVNDWAEHKEYTVIMAEEFLKKVKEPIIQYKEMEKGDLKISENTVVNCTTKELAEKVLSKMNALGYVIATKNFRLDSAFEVCGSSLCFVVCDNDIEWCDIDYYKSVAELSIISAEEFLKLHGDEVANHAPIELEKNLVSNIEIHEKESFLLEDTTKDQSILSEAHNILNGSRKADYGDAVDNFEHIAAVVNVAFRRDDVTPELCCMVHIATKLCREGNKHKRDNLVDLAAYSDIFNQIRERKK